MRSRALARLTERHGRTASETGLPKRARPQLHRSERAQTRLQPWRSREPETLSRTRWSGRSRPAARLKFAKDSVGRQAVRDSVAARDLRTLIRESLRKALWQRGGGVLISVSRQQARGAEGCRHYGRKNGDAWRGEGNRRKQPWAKDTA